MTLRRITGSLTGPVSARPTTGALLTDPSGVTHFAIGGLGFQVAISDERPYQRATAQFRKEQFDSATSVGDQSLTGWWTRGQLSFHRGAGVRYYEVLDGDAITHRFYTSSSVDVSEPGVVTLAGEWVEGSALFGAAQDAVNTDSEVVWLTDTQVYSTASGAAYSPTSGTATAVAAGINEYVYVGTSADKVERTTSVLGAGTVLYTSSNDVDYLWYAKDRLWLLDGAGVLSQLSPNPTAPPVAVGAGDRVCSFSEAGGTWFMAESPGAVFFAHSSGVVYQVSIGDDGSLPTLAAPVEVTRLPRGVTLVAIGYYLGYLVLQTTDGVRMAAVQDGGVVLGPEFLELDASAHTRRTVAGVENKVYVTGDSSVVAIDLAQASADLDLAFAWSTEAEVTGLRGVALHELLPVAYSDDAYYTRSASVLAPSGFLRTGLHRFGTLEPKSFASLRVLVAGAGGSVGISRVDADGTVTPLYTIDVTEATEADITLSMPDTASAVGLRFDLARDGSDSTKGPELLGYQLRGLPAPKRQRMIRLPLMLFDTERTIPGRATGADGSAWTRLQLLEQMEESGGIFAFQDFRTGESGTCYIESVEHEGKTPPHRGENGFGGFVYLTIRKLT